MEPQSAGIPAGPSATLAQQQGLPLGMIPPPPPPPPTAVEVQGRAYAAHTAMGYKLSHRLGLVAGALAVLAGLGYLTTKPLAASGTMAAGRVTAPQVVADPMRKYVWITLTLAGAFGAAGVLAYRKHL